MRPSWVADSSIWFDLDAGGLVEAALAFGPVWRCPDVLLDELQSGPEAGTLQALGVEVCELSGEEVALAARLAPSGRGASRVDLFTLVLALRPGSVLLTGDADLRRLAMEAGCEVHGVLWLLDRLVETTLSPARAVEALERIVQRGSRLPAREVSERLARWRPPRDRADRP